MHYGHVKVRDFMKELMELILNKLIGTEVTAKIGFKNLQTSREDIFPKLSLV